MSEVRTETPAAVDPAIGAAEAGRLLRAAREAAGLHVAALAVALKVPVGKLEALEAGRIDLLPDAVFARGLASSICRTLKLDPRPVLELLPQLGAARIRTDETNINAPFRAAGAPSHSPWQGQLRRPLVVIVALLLVGALVLLLLPTLRWEQSPAKSDPVLPPTVSEQVPSGSVDAAAGGNSGQGQATPSSVAPAEPAPAAAAPAAPPNAAAAPAAPAAVASAPGVVPATAADGVLVIQPRGETWVQVVDAKGVVALRKTLAAGETTGVSGTLPLSVIVGRADATVVQVRGKTLDLAPLARDNVARFEVK